MDIAGTSNSLLYTRSKQEEVPGPWLDDDDAWGNTVIQQKIMKDYIENETMRYCDIHLISLEDIRSLIGTSLILGDILEDIQSILEILPFSMCAFNLIF